MTDSEVKVVCVIGSSRFKDRFREIGERLEKSGRLALMMSFFAHADGVEVTDEERAVLERVDRKRIDMADEILVVDEQRMQCPRCRRWVENDSGEVCGCPQSERLWWKRENWKWMPYIGLSAAAEIAYAESVGKPVKYLSREEVEGA